MSTRRALGLLNPHATRDRRATSTALAAGARRLELSVPDGADRPSTYRVDVPGGTLHVTWTADDHMLLAGPAAIVARGEMEWLA